MFRLILKDPVYLVLDHAYRWYDQQLPALGEQLLDEIEGYFTKLRTFPFHYNIMRDVFRAFILKHFPYKIVFRIYREDVIIYEVYHTS